MHAGIEGSPRIETGNGAALVPSAELGMRRDGGRALPGTGMYIGAAAAYTNPARGISFGYEGHSLVAHQASGARELGSLCMVRCDAYRRTGEGLCGSLAGGFGANRSGGMNALYAVDKIENFKVATEADSGEHLNLDIGYGVRAFGNRYTSRPSATMSLADTGSAWWLGWCVTSAAGEPLNISGTVNVAPRDGEYSVGLLISARF